MLRCDILHQVSTKNKFKEDLRWYAHFWAKRLLTTLGSLPQRYHTLFVVDDKQGPFTYIGTSATICTPAWYQPCNTNEKVRFIEDHLIKPHASVLVSRPANCIPFQFCNRTPEAASYSFFSNVENRSNSGCRLKGYLIPLATYTSVFQCQEINREMLSLFYVIPFEFFGFYPSLKYYSSLLYSSRLILPTWSRILVKISNAILSVLPRLLAQTFARIITYNYSSCFYI